MNNYDMSVMSQEMPQQLSGVLTDISDRNLMQQFLRDVMTKKEITEISARYEAAKMLVARATYTDIIKRTKLSSRTVARISDWLQNGPGGYRAVIDSKHHTHTSPEVVG